MAKALTAVGVALAVLIGGLGLAVYLTRDEDNLQVDNMLAENLTKAIALAQSDTGGRVAIAQLTGFGWDRVLLVQRNTPARVISRRLGHPWTGVVGFRTGELFLFMRGTRVVRFADYRGAGRFAGFARPFTVLPRERAVLRVRELVVRPAASLAPRGAPGEPRTAGAAPATIDVDLVEPWEGRSADPPARRIDVVRPRRSPSSPGRPAAVLRGQRSLSASRPASATKAPPKHRRSHTVTAGRASTRSRTAAAQSP